MSNDWYGVPPPFGNQFGSASAKAFSSSGNEPRTSEVHENFGQQSKENDNDMNGERSAKDVVRGGGAASNGPNVVPPLPPFSTGYFQSIFPPGCPQPFGPLPPIDCKPTLAANIDPEIAKSIENIAKVSFKRSYE